MSLNTSQPRSPSASSRPTSDALKAAFSGDDLRQICRAVDAAVLEHGITQVAQNAQVDRTTIFRAFRREKGPALDTMVRILHVLGWRLIVEIKPHASSEKPRSDANTTARSLTLAFRGNDLDFAIETLAKVLRSQENVSELARTIVVSRENLYRSFVFPRVPRFRTVLSFLNAMELRFGIERLHPKKNEAESQRMVGRRVGPGKRPKRPDDRARNTSRKGRAKKCTL